MPPPIQMRLDPGTLADLDALAASSGSRTQSDKECVGYFFPLVAEAATKNATDLSADEWRMLAHTGSPDVYERGDDTARYPDWSHLLAHELVGMWEGKPVILPSHKDERAFAARLARKIGGWGPIRGYALMAAVRWFWRHPDATDAWWWPEVWLVAEVRDDPA